MTPKKMSEQGRTPDGPTELRLIGPPEAVTGGRAVSSFRTSRVPALVGLLAVQGGCSRDRAASLLWPDRDQESARHNLRQTLVYARRLLGESAFMGDRNRLELSPDIPCDVARFLAVPRMNVESESHAAAIRGVIGLYRGPFLEGLHDDWLLEPRAQLSHAFVELLLLLADYELSRDPSSTLELSTRAVQEEPFLDGARARKIRALRALGENAAAEREFRDFEKLLRDELMISPARLVRDALTDAHDSTLHEHDEARIPRAISSAVQELARIAGGEAAVDLAIALTPWMILKRVTVEGQKLLESALSDVNGLPLATKQTARVCVAELLAARGEIAAARTELETILPCCTDPRVRSRSLLRLAAYALHRYRAEAAMHYGEEALEIAIAIESPRGELEALRLLAKAAFMLDDMALCESLTLRVKELAERLNDNIAVADALQTYAAACHRQNDHGRAREAVYEALARLDDIDGRTAAGVRLGASRRLEDLSHFDEAAAGYERGISEARELEATQLLALALTYLGDLRTAQGRYEESIALHREARELRGPLRDVLGAATSDRGMGKALLLRGRPEEARAALVESAEGFAQAEAIPGYASALLLLAQAERELGRRALALRIARRAASLFRGMSMLQRMTIGSHGHEQLQEAERLTSELRG